MSAEKIKQLRLQRAWSQEQLAEAAGVSVRTVQRVENGATPGLETLKALAAVYDVTVDELRGVAEPTTDSAQAEPVMDPKHQEKTDMNSTPSTANPELQSDQAREDQKEFYKMAARFTFILIFLLIVNLATSPYLWVQWPALGMGLALVSRAATVFGVWGSKRERGDS
ncbi:2TM domain-containing protein [Alteromonadaceae bacterium 2753L.S.0a.02]|nr:2TM domain-containing protein [Alteromonadaceae bacterium 2753L.S.0a.02]